MVPVEFLHIAAACTATFLAGAINSVAGGGTLVSFPTLLWLGLASITANATSTVAIWPGSLGSIWGFRRELLTRGNGDPLNGRIRQPLRLDRRTAKDLARFQRYANARTNAVIKAIKALEDYRKNRTNEVQKAETHEIKKQQAKRKVEDEMSVEECMRELEINGINGVGHR